MVETVGIELQAALVPRIGAAATTTSTSPVATCNLVNVVFSHTLILVQFFGRSHK